MIGGILAAVSAAGSLYGTLKSAQANKLQEAQLKKRQTELQNWYDKEYNTNYLDTSAARGTLQILRNNNRETMKKVSQRNAIGGASDEKAVATADAVQKNYANNVAGVAAQGTARQDRIQGSYDMKKMNLDNLQAANLAQKSANWSNFTNNAMSAGIGFAEAGASGAFDKWDNKLGTLFKNGKAKVKTPKITV